MTSASATLLEPEAPHRLAAAPPAVVEAREVSRRFGAREALRGVSLAVPAGGIHAILGRNGAGKTTLLRILSGLVSPDRGAVSLLGEDAAGMPRRLQGQVGLVPSGDRTFYLRLSGFENLLFFARLQSMRRRTAAQEARRVLEAVGLADDGARRVGEYSHGMQKRLSVARALLTRPRVLLVDEATHDLDPHAAAVVRELVQREAEGGAAVIWATQRLDELRSFAHRVVLLRQGEVCFEGTVAALSAHAVPSVHMLRLRGDRGIETLRAALGPLGRIAPTDDPGHYRLRLADGAVLGAALAALTQAGIDVIGCRDERSDVEEAFVRLTERP